jgi:hypothetical protein
MAKVRPLDLSRTRTETVTIEGVKVTVCLDASGRLVSARSALWHTEDRERLHRLAIAHVCALAERAAQARSDAARITKSAEHKRTKARAAAQFAERWLAKALTKNPDLGADRLALAARRLLAAQPHHPDYTKRAQISEYRAKQYLRAQKKSGDM